MIPYIENFLTEYEADELFEALLALGGKREKNKRNNISYLRRISYPGWSPELDHRPAAQYTTVPYDTAPDFIKVLADKLTAFAGKEIRYLSAVGYENEKDHMNWHQHKEDKRPRHCEDMTVWVVNLGEVRTIGIRTVGSNDKSQYEYLRPKHGSLYILPSSYNITHEHAVLEDEFPCGLRISINCKHIPPQTPSPSGKKPAKKSRDKDSLYKPINGDGPCIYCQRVGYSYPADAVNVDRKTIFGNFSGTPKERFPYGSPEYAAYVADKMKSPEFSAQVESLRGKNLLCWCEPHEADHCHARAWLELANGTTTDGPPKPPGSQPPKRKKPRAASSTKIPAFAYPGGKARLAEDISAMLPRGNRFVEPFAGRGNVYFHVAAHGMYPSYWLNDIQTAPFLFTLRIGHILSVPENTKENLVKFRARARGKVGYRDGRFISPLQVNHAFLVEPYLCWNGGAYGQSGGTRRGTQVGYGEKIRAASEILRRTDTNITRLDYRKVLGQCGDGDVVYLDPPYLNANVKAYSDKTLDHRELVEILKNAKFKWVLSEYRQPLYIEAFGEPAIEIHVKRGMGNPGGGSKGQKHTVECFWMNFSLTASCEQIQRAA